MQKICVTIPCYNEAARLKKEAILNFININESVNFCFVNDGSLDNTLAMLEELRNHVPERIFVINLKKNSGKANAVREGILWSIAQNQFSFVGYWDADLSTPLSELPAMIGCFSSDDIKGVIGSRVKRMGAMIERKFGRHLLGRVFSTCSNWILKFPVYDSQCGAKLFRTAFAEKIFKDKFISKWLFDVELLARSRNEFGASKCVQVIVEMPLLEWRDVKGSKLKLKDYIRVPLDLIKIHLHYNS